MKLIKVKKLFQNGTFYGLCDGTVNCDKITNGTPRPAWLTRTLGACCGTETVYQLTFEDPKDPSALQGIWVEQDENVGVLIDATTVDQLIDACNECCGETVTIAQRYASGIPATTVPVVKTYTVTRADDGSMQATNKASLDYYGKYITFTRTGYSGGNSTYVMTAYQDFPAVGTDTLVETARVFLSNAPTTPAGSGNHHAMTVVADGVTLGVVNGPTNGTIANLVTAATSALGSAGTWSAAESSTKVQLSTTKYDVVTLTIAVVAD